VRGPIGAVVQAVCIFVLLFCQFALWFDWYPTRRKQFALFILAMGVVTLYVGLSRL
jgi:hypothetical protein